MTKNGILILVSIFLLVAGVSFFITKQKQNALLLKNSQNEVSNIDKVESDVPVASGTVSTKTATLTEMAREISEITLTITSPQNGTSVNSSKVSVKGKTSAKAEVFANEAEGVADSSGGFTLSVMLDEGENSIIVTAVDVNGKVAEKEILITYDVGE